MQSTTDHKDRRLDKVFTVDVLQQAEATGTEHVVRNAVEAEIRRGYTLAVFVSGPGRLRCEWCVALA
jgi:hypothetical protein